MCNDTWLDAYITRLTTYNQFKSNTLSITHAFNEIQHAKPEAIIMVGAYKTNALFIKKAKESESMKDTIFCNISFGDANAMISELDKMKTDSNNLIFSQVVPNYLNTKIPVIQEYQALMKKYYPNEKLGFISLEAFLASKVLVNAISRIKGDMTREKLLHTLKTTPPEMLDGLYMKFENSQLLNNTYLFEYKDLKFKELQ